MLYIECLRHNEREKKEIILRKESINLYAERTEAEYAATTYKYLRSPPIQSFFLRRVHVSESPTCGDAQRRVDGGDSPTWWGLDEHPRISSWSLVRARFLSGQISKSRMLSVATHR
jgi:hypothetical protein